MKSSTVERRPRASHNGRDTVSELDARITDALHSAIDDASERIRGGREAVVESGKHAIEAVDERVRSHPKSTVAMAFGMGFAACALLRAMSRR